MIVYIIQYIVCQTEQTETESDMPDYMSLLVTCQTICTIYITYMVMADYMYYIYNIYGHGRPYLLYI